jgi:hypothetical protein
VVFASKAELPPAAIARLPNGFDFSKQLIAGVVKADSTTTEIVVPKHVVMLGDGTLQVTAHVTQAPVKPCHGGINTPEPRPLEIGARVYTRVTVLVILERKFAMAAKQIVVIDTAETNENAQGVVRDPKAPCPPYG